MWLGILVAVLYGAIAVFANFINKYAIRVLPLPNVILFIQTLAASVLLRLMAACNLFRVPPLREVPVYRLAPLTAWYTAHAALVLCSLASLSVPMYNTLKRLTPVIVLIAKAVLDKAVPDLHTALSVLLIVSGCFIAGAGDLSFDFQGYLLALLATVAQAAYIMSAERELQGGPGKPAAATGSDSGSCSKAAAGHHHHRQPSDIETKSSSSSTLLIPVAIGAEGAGRGGNKSGAAADGGAANTAAGKASAAAGAETKDPEGARSGDNSSISKQQLSAPGLLYCLSVISMPVLAFLCVVTGEGSRAAHHLAALRVKMGDPGFAVWFATMAVTNGLLNGGVILCTQMNSALTTSIVGVLKGAVSSVLGFFLLGGVKFHALNVAGITMNMVGGIWYSANKFLQRKRGGGGGGSVLSG